MAKNPLISFLILFAISAGECSCSSDPSALQSGSGGQSAGGRTSTSGGTAAGGASSGVLGGSSSATGGSAVNGGSPASDRSAAGGNTAGGSAATGGDSANGGRSTTGGKASTNSSGITSNGGVIGKGGSPASGGTASTAGGTGGAAGSTRTGGAGPTAGRNSTPGASGASGLPSSAGRASGGAGGGTGGQSTPTAGSGGSTGYNPCKASPCVILPLGDSITHGFGSSDDAGYRAALYNLAVAANQHVTFIGSLTNGRNTPTGFVKNHEGHDGISVTGITGWVPPSKAFIETPHIVLLHIGTNDMTSNADPTTTAKQLDTLVTNLVAAAPNALIVVAKIVPLGYNNSNYTSYISKIPDVVKAHADKNQNVILVDMSTLPTSDIRGSGDVHPTDKGYSDMANLWYGAIKGYLP